ncbi:ABC transporter substrate-binding protein [Pseudoflavonifractor phocaeensis]|uniref:ABC transporter substrate-binding protein n=1 Tax=Pseudoflavonifractor phocaeensis TaxID=1870988 RepID=UPI001958C5DE|nr:spermidine/putrescine ABC transporter substrate-binding protein [Pseudoflavonifractor phocaeensis]MBM6885208.1 spermidine/putrescine ABC transporter substrate-binding protein [Pseudoflavonifractor phocaeensis]
MKKSLALLSVAALTLGALSGCGGTQSGTADDPGAADKGVVNVYNWGVYIDESVLEDFTAETGIKVVYDTFESNEAMYGVLKNEGASYDVVIPSDYMISRMIEEDMLEPLNFDNIPNFEDVDPALKNPDYDPENLYSVPYMWGLLGIIYNTSMVEETPTSWDIMFDENYSGQILMFNNSRDAIGIALKQLGYSYNTTDENQIKEAVDLLIQQKPLVQSYVMDDIFEKMQSGSAAIGAYYYGDFLTMQEVNPDLAFCLPEEGTNLYVDAMCIPKNAENKENAEIFINYMCSTQAGLKNCEEIWYSSPLLSVREELDPEVSGDPYAYPDESILAQCESFKNLPADTLALYDSEWTRLMLASN